MVIPYRVDVPFNHKPVANWILIASIVIAFFTTIFDMESSQRFVLEGWDIRGLFGHMWLHGGIVHLIGNLIFLWVFGNAVCSKVGNIFYLPIYVTLGLIAAVSHNIFTGGPAIGASGAINGIVGMYLVFFPENEMDCFFLLLFKPIYFTLSGYWMILLWFVFDILGAANGGGNVAYFAHIGGFLGGFGMASLLLKLKLIVMEDDEKTIYDILSRKKKKSKISHEENGYWQRELKKAEMSKNHSVISEPIIIKPEIESLRFNCSCGQKIKVPKIYAGKKGRCPKCKVQLEIPYE